MRSFRVIEAADFLLQMRFDLIRKLVDVGIIGVKGAAVQLALFADFADRYLVQFFCLQKLDKGAFNLFYGFTPAAVVFGTPEADSVSDSVETAMPAVSADDCVAVSALSCVLPWFVNIINAVISRMRTTDRIIIIEICFLLFNLLMLQ